MNEENFIKCDFCNLPAKINMQKVWTKFNINIDGGYKEDEQFDTFEIEEPINNDNLHFCKKDFEKWIDGGI